MPHHLKFTRGIAPRAGNVGVVISCGSSRYASFALQQIASRLRLSSRARPPAPRSKSPLPEPIFAREIESKAQWRELLGSQKIGGEAADAKRMPAREAAYRNLILNQRVEASSPFVTPSAWQACAGAPLDLTGRDVFGGLDLSATQDLTALVLISCDIAAGTWHVAPKFWLPGEGLHEKARADRTPYDLWA